MATLAELDEKLAALQREMHGVHDGPDELSVADIEPPAAGGQYPADHSPLAASVPGATAGSVPPAPAAARPAPERRPVSLSDLTLWRQHLRRGLGELTGLGVELDAAIARLETSSHPAAADPVPAVAIPAATASAPPVPTPHDRIFEGRVLVDAGPFVDIAAVTTFHQALEHVTGARDVYVTGFDFNRALVELELDEPVALGREIRAVLPFNFAIFEAGRGRLAINVDAHRTAHQATLR